uniref:Uncharacterized protein n=1 Tax=Arundo donax TaxID=35708 RepID=A0A0A9FXE1_ARUDO
MDVGIGFRIALNNTAVETDCLAYPSQLAQTIQ